MEFLQQQQIDGSSFVSNFVTSNSNIIDESNSSNLISLPLNFAHVSSLTNVVSIGEHQHHLLSTSQPQIQVHSPQPHQHMIMSSQQQAQQMLKQENMNNFLHAAIQQTSMESSGSSQNELNLEQSPSLQLQNELNHSHHQQSSASSNNSSLNSSYGSQNLPDQNVPDQNLPNQNLL